MANIGNQAVSAMVGGGHLECGKINAFLISGTNLHNEVSSCVILKFTSRNEQRNKSKICISTYIAIILVLGHAKDFLRAQGNSRPRRIVCRHINYETTKAPPSESIYRENIQHTLG